MTTKETSRRSLISSTAAPNQGATRAFALIPKCTGGIIQMPYSLLYTLKKVPNNNVDMGRVPLEVDLTRKGKSFKYLEDVCTCAIPLFMPIGQVLDGTSTIRKNPVIV
ncbi:hypothetical protein TNCV_4978011 [Trichonephila clavipes]|nr:hypothetical protein TNCV_4978011 [Trichonephila clavipes]